MVQVKAAETDPAGGGGIQKNCDCHLFIEEVEVVTGTDQDTGETKTQLKIKFNVLAGTEASENGKHITEFFALDGKAAGKMWTLLVAAGLTTREQWRAAVDNNTGLDFNEMMLKGRQVCGQIRMEKYRGKKVEWQGKDFANLGFRIMSVFEDQAKAIPRDKAMMMMVPGYRPDAGGGNPGASGQTAPLNPPPNPSQPPASAGTPASPPAAPATQAPGGFNW